MQYGTYAKRVGVISGIERDGPHRLLTSSAIFALRDLSIVSSWLSILQDSGLKKKKSHVKRCTRRLQYTGAARVYVRPCVSVWRRSDPFRRTRKRTVSCRAPAAHKTTRQSHAHTRQENSLANMKSTPAASVRAGFAIAAPFVAGKTWYLRFEAVILVTSPTLDERICIRATAIG